MGGPIVRIKFGPGSPLQGTTKGKGKPSPKSRPSPHEASARAKDAHDKLRAKGLTGQHSTGKTLPLMHLEANKAGGYPESVFVSTSGDGEKVRVNGRKQPFSYMDYVRAGKPNASIKQQLHEGESLVKVGSNIFIMHGVSLGTIRKFDGELLVEK